MESKTAKKTMWKGNIINTLTVLFCVWSWQHGYQLSALIKTLVIVTLVLSPLGVLGNYFGISTLNKPTKYISTITDLAIFAYFIGLGSVGFAVAQAFQWIICEIGHAIHADGYESAKKFFHDNIEDESKIPEIYR